jgi:IMP cyclohydrolase
MCLLKRDGSEYRFGALAVTTQPGSVIYLPRSIPVATMYVGRFVVVGPGVGAYRVSSRSFPNRQAVAYDDRVAVEPTPDAPPTDNPYVSYNGLREVSGSAADGEDRVVVGNGSHVDPIAEKLGLGYPARDALASALLALDYEKDDYDTPRIAGVASADRATIGIVRRDALLVHAVEEPTLVATYEVDEPEPVAFDPDDAASAARGVYDFEYEHAVCATAATVEEGGIERAIYNGPDGD